MAAPELIYSIYSLCFRPHCLVANYVLLDVKSAYRTSLGSAGALAYIHPTTIWVALALSQMSYLRITGGFGSGRMRHSIRRRFREASRVAKCATNSSSNYLPLATLENKYRGNPDSSQWALRRPTTCYLWAEGNVKRNWWNCPGPLRTPCGSSSINARDHRKVRGPVRQQPISHRQKSSEFYRDNKARSRFRRSPDSSRA